MLFRRVVLGTLSAGTVAQSTSQCRYKNGTALPTGGNWDWYQPCPGTAICCALNRDNSPGGNRTLGLTRDECLPNGLCQNRASERKVAIQWWVNYCTEVDWHGGKCMDICPAGITQVMSCDGTATGERWCCGNSTDCCSTNIGVVTLKHVFNIASTMSASSTPIMSATISQASTSVIAIDTYAETSTADRSSRSVAGGVIAGAVTGAIVGLAALLAASCLARRRSRKTMVEKKQVEGSLLAEACAMSQRHELSSTAQKHNVQELPGMPPGELLGNVAPG